MDVLLINQGDSLSCDFSPRAHHELDCAEWKKLDCSNVNALRKECVAKGLKISSLSEGQTLEKMLADRGEWEAIVRIKNSQPDKLHIVWDNLEDALMNLNHQLDYLFLSKLFQRYGTYGDD
jgi:hypothetical protein